MLFKDITILNENFDVEEHMNVAVKGNVIEYIGKDEPAGDYGRIIAGENRMLMPGFYNAHAHSPMGLMRGYGENLALQDWLTKKIFPFEDKLDSNAVYWGTLLCMAESLKFGIVSTSDMYYFVPDMVAAVVESGAKSNISRSITNFTGEEFDKMQSVKEAIYAAEKFNGTAEGRVIIDASLHAEYTSDEKTAKALAEMTKAQNLIMHVHVSETKLEHEECKERHNGLTPVQYLNKCGIFDSPSIAAHCVWIEGDDYDILRDKRVTVATNPVSNLKLASGICDVNALLSKGINVAIGTDSVASNNSLNFIEEMKTLALLGKIKNNDPKIITPKDVLKAATVNGAKAQGRENCGVLKTGNRADLIMLKTDEPNMHPIHNLSNNIVYSASGNEISMTMVDGKILYENGEYNTIDIEKTIYETEKATKEILGKL